MPDSGTAVHDSTEQAQWNLKEACTATVTITVVQVIPCAYKLLNMQFNQNLMGRGEKVV